MFGLAALLLALALEVVAGYFLRQDWTGVVRAQQGRTVVSKSLWDWLQLLVFPLVLAGLAAWLSFVQKQYEWDIAENNRRSDRDIADNRLRDATLDSYLGRMADLLLDSEKQLREYTVIPGKLEPSARGNEASIVARAWTLAILPRLDNQRKGVLLRFLYESRLIDKFEYHVDLRLADLAGAELQGFNLRHAKLDRTNLAGAHLEGAQLRGVSLRGAELSGASLRDARPIEAILRRAVLRNADLTQANLSGADMNGADLSGADLTDAVLNGANIAPEQLLAVKSHQGATLPEGMNLPDP